ERHADRAKLRERGLCCGALRHAGGDLVYRASHDRAVHPVAPCPARARQHGCQRRRAASVRHRARIGGIRPAMKRNAVFCAALAACSGARTNKPSTIQDNELGRAKHATRVESVGDTTPRADSAMAFRKAYVDPGGMWMPMQMALAQHVETFQKM